MRTSDAANYENSVNMTTFSCLCMSECVYVRASFLDVRTPRELLNILCIDWNGKVIFGDYILTTGCIWVCHSDQLKCNEWQQSSRMITFRFSIWISLYCVKYSWWRQCNQCLHVCVGLYDHPPMQPIITKRSVWLLSFSGIILWGPLCAWSVCGVYSYRTCIICIVFATMSEWLKWNVNHILKKSS